MGKDNPVNHTEEDQEFRSPNSVQTDELAQQATADLARNGRFSLLDMSFVAFGSFTDELMKESIVLTGDPLAPDSTPK